MKVVIISTGPFTTPRRLADEYIKYMLERCPPGPSGGVRRRGDGNDMWLVWHNNGIVYARRDGTCRRDPVEVLS